MLDFPLQLTKADTGPALYYRLVKQLDEFMGSGDYIEHKVGGGVSTLTPNANSTEHVSKIKSLLIKITNSPDTINTDLWDVLKRHEYEFGFVKDPNPFDSKLVVSTPKGVLTMRLF